MYMSGMIQIRNVPDALHRRIKSRAALSGMSMSRFILMELQKVVERPTREEILQQIARYPTDNLEPPPAEAIRKERETR